MYSHIPDSKKNINMRKLQSAAECLVFFSSFNLADTVCVNVLVVRAMRDTDCPQCECVCARIDANIEIDQ